MRRNQPRPVASPRALTQCCDLGVLEQVIDGGRILDQAVSDAIEPGSISQELLGLGHGFRDALTDPAHSEMGTRIRRIRASTAYGALLLACLAAPGQPGPPPPSGNTELEKRQEVH